MSEVINADTILARIKQAVNVAGEGTHRDCYYALYEDPQDPTGKPINYDEAREAFRILQGSAYDYVDRGEPKPVESHCIVGTVLVDLGVPITTLTEFENQSVTAIYQHRDVLPIEIDPVGWEALGEAQSRQDDGQDWGDASDAADRLVRRFKRVEAGTDDEHVYFNVANG